MHTETQTGPSGPVHDGSFQDGPRRALPILLAAATLVVMAGAVISPVVVVIRDEFGLSPVLAGLVIVTHALLLAIASPVVGTLVDRVGTRRVLLAGLIGYGVFGALGALAPTYELLLASRVLFGISAAAVFNGMTVSLLNLWSGRAQGTVMGYFSSANSLGGVVWPLLGGLLGLLGWRAPFLLYLVALPIALAAVWLVPDSRAAAAGGGSVRMISVMRTSPVLLWLYGMIFIVSLLLYGIIVFVPQRLGEMGIGQPILVAVFVVVANVVAVVVGIYYGRLRSRLDDRRVFLIGTALLVLGFLPLFLATEPWMLLIGTPLFGAGLALILAGVPAGVGSAVPSQARGRAISYMTSTMLLGQFMSPLLLGTVAGANDVRAVFALGTAVAVLLFAAVAVGFRPSRGSAADSSTEPMATERAQSAAR